MKDNEAVFHSKPTSFEFPTAHWFELSRMPLSLGLTIISKDTADQLQRYEPEGLLCEEQNPVSFRTAGVVRRTCLLSPT